ncbi:MAG: LysR family transcriptional regulator [Myxococcota bacterium]
MNLGDVPWDDVRFFLATLRAPSLRQAAEDLGVSHPTASRRVRALEEGLGLQLFERRADGLHPTAEAMELAAAAEEVERAMFALQRVAKSVEPAIRGPVHLTMTQPLATDLLMPDLHAFSLRYPELELHLQINTELSNLAAREADVAIRGMAAGRSPDPDLMGRRAVSTSWAVYGSGACWLGPEDRRAMFEGAILSDEADFFDLPVRGTYPGISLKRAACLAGVGYARLPCFYGDPVLPRRSSPVQGGDIWVLVTPNCGEICGCAWSETSWSMRCGVINPGSWGRSRVTPPGPKR